MINMVLTKFIKVEEETKPYDVVFQVPLVSIAPLNSIAIKKSQHYAKSNAAKYSLKVHAGQLPLPIGVTTIIDAFSKSIDPVASTKKVE